MSQVTTTKETVMYLTQLKQRNITELNEIARELKIEGAANLRKQELIFAILQAQTVNDPVLFGLGLENGEDQLLLAQVRRSFDLQLPGDLVQFGDVPLFELSQIHNRFFSRRHLGHTLHYLLM